MRFFFPRLREKGMVIMMKKRIGALLLGAAVGLSGMLQVLPAGAASVNVASGKPVTVSDGVNPYGEPANLTDGDPNTICSCKTYYEECVPLSFTIDLQETFAIEEIAFLTRNIGANTCQPLDFTIDVWNGSDWQTVVNVINFGTKNWDNSGTFDHFPLNTAVNGSKVRLTATKYEKNIADGDGLYALQLMEMQVFGGEPLTENTNICLGKDVTVSDGYHPYGPPANLTDGDKTTICSSVDGYDECVPLSFTIHLGGTYDIDEVAFLTRHIGRSICCPKTFTIDIWNGSEWQTVVDQQNYITKNSDGSGTYDTFPLSSSVRGSFIRITATDYELDPTEDVTNYRFQLMEFRASGEMVPNVTLDYPIIEREVGENIAQGAYATASSADSEWGYTADKAIDGRLSSEFRTLPVEKADNTAWIELDLGDYYDVSEIILRPAFLADGFPRDFTIQVKGEGDWTEIASHTDYPQPFSCSDQVFTFETMPVKKVRIEATELTASYKGYALAFSEILVYEKPSGQVTPDETAITDVQWKGTVEDFDVPQQLQKAVSAGAVGVRRIWIGAALLVVAVAAGVTGGWLLFRRPKTPAAGGRTDGE